MISRACVLATCGCCLLLSGCGDDVSLVPGKPRQTPGWYQFGLDDSWATELELAYPYLYACTTEDGLFRTPMTGEDPNWEYLGFQGEWCHDAHVLDNGAILVGLSPGLQRSQDGGSSWVRSDSGMVGGPHNVTCFASCGDEILAGTFGRGLYRSKDQGLSWTKLASAPCEGLYYQQIRFHPLDCDRIWLRGGTNRCDLIPLVSLDGGNEWESIRLLVHPNLHWSYSIGLDPFDIDVVYVGCDGLVLKSIDGGSSWATVLHPPGGLTFAAIEADNLTRGHFFFAGGDSLCETHDGGATVESLGSAKGRDIFDLVYDAPNSILYVATRAGVFKYVL